MAGGKRKAEEEKDAGKGDAALKTEQKKVWSFDASPGSAEAPDGKRKADCLNTVTALNTQFASWIEKQKQDRPFDLWRGGVQDYLKHAEKILSDFHDVVDWLTTPLSAPNGSAAETSKQPENKSPAAEATAFKGWGNPAEKAPAANGAPKEQGTVFAWAPASKINDPGTIGKGEDCKGGFLGFAPQKEEVGGGKAPAEGSKEDAGGSFPGWGTEFGAAAKAPSQKGGSKNGNVEEGGKGSLFTLPTAGSKGPSQSSVFQPLSKSASPAGSPPVTTVPGPLFTMPVFPPKDKVNPPESTKGIFPTTIFSVPAFSPAIQAAPLPAIKTSVATTGGGIDWASGFSKPAFTMGGGSTFSLPGAKALAGGPLGEAQKKTTEEGSKEEPEEEAEEGEIQAEPPSPSFKAAKEEGVENVLDTPIRMYRKGTNGAWEDQGTGSLTLKRDKGAPLQSKEANARVVFRNSGGKVLLNARLYVGMKLEVNKESLSTILHLTETSTLAKGEGEEKQAEPVAEVVTRLYTFKRPKKGGMAAEELKAALEKEVPK